MSTFRLYYITATLLLLISLFGSILLFREVVIRIEDYPEDIKDLNWSLSSKKPEEIPPQPVEDTTSYASAMGIDVSHYDGEVDWETMDPSITFVICKATQGDYFVDPKFDYNWKSIASSGRIRGAYHFYDSSKDPIKQANFFWKTVATYDENDLPLVLDIEPESLKNSISKDALQDDLLSFLSKVEELSGKKPIVYVDTSFANEYLTRSVFANYPLWIADYTNKAAPTLPTTWQQVGWDFWQRSATYKERGISGNVDYDLFDGDAKSLQNFASNKNF